MKTIIFNCDDLGLSEGVNDAVKKLYAEGILKSGTTLVNADKAQEALSYFPKLEDFSCGIHFCLTFGKTSSEALKHIVDEKGNFKSQLEVLELLDKEEEEDILEELESQLKKFLELSNGVNPSHIDSHHHIHQHPKVEKAVIKIALRLGVSVRSANGKSQEKNGVFFHPFVVDFYNLFDIDKLISILKDSENFSDVMAHPSSINDVENISSYNQKRVDEFEFLLGNKKEILENFKIGNLKGD